MHAYSTCAYNISLGVGTECANSVGFRWSPMLPDLCPLCVYVSCRGGGGLWGILGKPVKALFGTPEVCMLYGQHV